LLGTACCAQIGAATADAGTYTVTQTCGAWDAVNNAPSRIAIYTECPALIVRNVGGPFASGPGQEARWEFWAPAGAAVDHVSMSGSLMGLGGWQATILTSSGVVLENCPGATCPGGGISFAFLGSPVGTAGVYLRLRCGANQCPNDQGLKGFLDMRWFSATIADASAPGVAITGGNLLAGWRRGTGTVAFDASDNVGIRTDRIIVDGTPRGQTPRACADGLKYPCPNGPSSLQLDTTRVPDGQHTLRVESVDSAGNVGGQDRGILIDNTPPTAATDLAAQGGDAWQPTNSFVLSWRNPRQTNAPIAGVEYEFCPLSNALADHSGCSRGFRDGTDIAGLSGLAVPRAGAWRLRLWLRDAAGNTDPSSAVTSALRFDDTPPTVVFLEQTQEDPTLLRLNASDTVSGVDRAEIEVRREGEDAWRPLPVERTPEGFSARADDELLPRGLYELRARVVDRAGNERSTTSRTNGQPAVLKLPVRAPSTLQAGRAGRLRCGRRGPSQRCVRRLVANPSVAFGHGTRLVGRLQSAGRPLSGATVEVWSQVELPGAPWRRVAVLRSNRSGHVRFRAAPGPARLLRFRYPGTPLVRGFTEVVELRVRAATTLRASRRDVVNGEYVTFRGRVKGGPLPATGKLVELQVFTRQRWRTFGQPRASARTGRWAFQYRFESIRGDVRFRFRARVRKEAGYPFDTGTSGSVSIRVRGL
jgi:hypothetical protein